MGRKIQIDQLADAVNEQLEEYSKLSAEVVKSAVTKAGNTKKKGIGENAPRNTGKYANTPRETVAGSGRYRTSHRHRKPERNSY